jgi:hypothetical protein
MSDLEGAMTMNQNGPIGAVVSLGLLTAGSYMLYDAATNPLPGATMGLIGGAVFWSLGAFVGFFSCRRSGHGREMFAAGHGDDGTRSSWRIRAGARRGRTE